MGARILVVEDDEAVRTAIQRTLVAAGYEVECAAGGYAGIRRMDGGRFALVLTDIHMAEGDGLELLIHARRHHPGVPVMAMSGRDDGAILEAALGLGARSVLAKPFSMQRLIEELDRALAKDEDPGSPPR